MNEVLTRNEIETRFPSEWLLINDPDVDQHMSVTRGTVVAHSMDRDEVYQKAIELRLQHAAFLYTGQIPDDMVIVL